METKQTKRESEHACEKCYGNFGYMKKNGEFQCRKCGHITKIKEDEN